MLTTEDYTHFPVQMWERVLSKVKKAVVFMDDKCAESLHWCGGAAVLLEAGARNLKQFSSFEACGVNEPKAVFVVSTLLKGTTVEIIKDIISLSHFQYCVVITTVAHSVHLLANNVTTELEGSPVFEQFEEKLCEWMGNMNYTAEVMHVPVVFAPVSQQLLLTPMFAHLFPLLPPDLESVNAKRPEKKRFGSLLDVDMNSLPVELQFEIKSLASVLNSVFEATATREESFAVGPMSRLIAGELANHPQAKNRRKAAPNKASIIFVDRTMDITGAVGHHGDNLVEKILSVLKPLPGHVTDVQVDMLELTSLQRTPYSQTTLAPGCLAQTQSPAAQTLWEAMLTNKHKEGVMEVRRQLVETASKEKLPIKMSMGRVTPEQLCSYMQLFKSSWGALESHCGVLQLGLATAQTLRHPSLPRWDACLAFERLLLQNSLSGTAVRRPVGTCSNILEETEARASEEGQTRWERMRKRAIFTVYEGKDFSKTEDGVLGGKEKSRHGATVPPNESIDFPPNCPACRAATRSLSRAETKQTRLTLCGTFSGEPVLCFIIVITTGYNEHMSLDPHLQNSPLPCLRAQKKVLCAGSEQA
ncbi:Sec1 family domain containing protein 2, partial [Dissostichus eleginoides]